ncbi:MAG: hypothetical protein RIM84_07185 [Alphaproteobacteria bacterium]
MSARPGSRRRHDVLHRLYRQGSLPGEAWRAAGEIRQIAERLETALMARPGTLGMPGQPRGGGPSAAPIERLPPALRVALRGRYRRWCDEMAAILVSRRPRLSLLSLTLAVTVHGARLRDLEAWLGIRRGHGHVRRWLVCALTRYAWLTDGVDERGASGLR